MAYAVDLSHTPAEFKSSDLISSTQRVGNVKLAPSNERKAIFMVKVSDIYRDVIKHYGWENYSEAKNAATP